MVIIMYMILNKNDSTSELLRKNLRRVFELLIPENCLDVFSIF